MNHEADDLPPNGSPESEDALRAIADIGPKYAEALHQIGVRTPSDLARYTPEQLAEELREKAGVRVTPDRIRAKDWIGQAQKLTRDEQEQGAAEAESGSSTGPEESGWRERGMFTIRFIEGYDPHGGQQWQIRVYHEGGTGSEMAFEGLDPNPWVSWIFEQMGQPGQAVQPIETIEPLEAAVPQEPEEPRDDDEPSYMEIADAPTIPLDALISEVEDVGIAFDEVDVIAWPPAPERFLVVEARFRFQGQLARELTQERAPYLLEFYLINLESQTSNQIGSNRGQMEPDRDDYELQMNFPMPAPGQYELQTIVLLPNQNTRAFRDGPTFQVVAAEEPRSSV